ncbi:helix-turn-helix domain-containing protein [Staphylococcus equorum]|uniref:helix-turn-helix domain-containing protein n=1 Tax=Staphylococcus equorum TaxID=246432 RepID=UPI000D1CE2F8|nr:AraC family transcriptional regulator [Staphylococcus equorum]PTE29605.1 AraC family transcriptional regulator [Staphylococcus equorum]
MNEETLEILQMHALQLLGIRLEGYDMSDMNGVINHIKTPFTNTARKQFNNELKHFIVQMHSNKIYHYTNRFGVNFLIFKFKKYKQIYIVGPYMEKRPNERRCNELLQSLDIKISKLSILKQYLLTIPLCHQVKAQKMCRLAIRFLKKRNSIYETVKIDFSFHSNTEELAESKAQMDYTLKEIEYRYNMENQLLTAVENGNANEALSILNAMNLSVAGLRRVRDDISNEQYKAYLINTLCRKAGEKAGVSLIHIDEISAKYAAVIDQTMDIETLDEITHSIVKAYTDSAMKVKANAYSPKVSKVIQYIERNLDSALSLNELASYVGLAPSYLSKIFNKEIHKSISQYIIESRVKKGRDLIARTKMTVAEVANYVGFKEQSYFTQCFKKQYGTTPLSYRTKHKEFY